MAERMTDERLMKIRTLNELNPMGAENELLREIDALRACIAALEAQAKEDEAGRMETRRFLKAYRDECDKEIDDK